MPLLEEVRQFVIYHYSEIFKYQVLDRQTGKPVLDLASSFGEEVSPFIHFCHLGTAFEICGTLFTGIGKALSLPSIALLSTICHHLLFRESRLLTRYLFTKFSRYLSFSLRPTLINNWQTPGPHGKVNFRVDKGSVFRHDLESAVSQTMLSFICEIGLCYAPSVSKQAPRLFFTPSTRHVNSNFSRRAYSAVTLLKK